MENFRKDKQMTNRIARGSLVVVFTATVVLLSMPVSVWAAEAEEDIWSDEAANARPRRFELTDERVEQFLVRMSEAHPERAEELRKLAKDNPEQFRKEMRETFFARRHQMREHPGEMARGEGRGDMHGRGPMAAERRHPAMGASPGRGDMHGRGPMAAERRRPAMGGTGRGGRGGERGRERWRERIQERHEEYIEWLNKNYSEEAKKLVGLREKDPEKYIKHVMASKERYGEIMEAQERNPELAEVLQEGLELKNNRSKLLKEVRTAEGKERKKLMEQLKEVVNRRFDLIVRKKQLRYVHLLEKLEKLQTEVQRREAEVEKLKNRKEQAVRERLEELTSKAEKIKWD
jgi:hypothetical protein